MFILYLVTTILYYEIPNLQEKLYQKPAESNKKK